MSQGIIGVLFSALTFAGVFTLLMGPLFASAGLGTTFTLITLLGVVATTFLGLGLFLDKKVKFWKAQALIGTVRNPFLLSRLYQKEQLGLIHIHLPIMKAVLLLLELEKPDFGPEGRETEKRRQELVKELTGSIARISQTIENKEWTVLPNENAYMDTDKT
jgi:hypothetical protein